MPKTSPSLPTSNERRQNIAQTCLRLLARREHSQRELLDKLALRGYRADEVQPVLSEFSAQHWQDDIRFAESFVRQRLAKGSGPLRIRYELQQRGITDIDIDAIAEEFAGGWQQILLDVYHHKYDTEVKLSRNEWLKRSRFLQQRGFSLDAIKNLCTELNIKLLPS